MNYNMILNEVRGVTTDVQRFLNDLGYAEYFVYIPVLLLGFCCLARLICLALTFISPSKFGSEHRKTICASARACYLLALVTQVLFWLFGRNNQIQLLGEVDIFAAGILAVLALAGFLAAIVSMIFPRKGKRVFIAKSLNFQALMMALMALFLGGYSWIFMK